MVTEIPSHLVQTEIEYWRDARETKITLYQLTLPYGGRPENHSDVRLIDAVIFRLEHIERKIKELTK